MELNWDGSKILYVVGGFLGIISIIYFGQELILNLSMAVKAFILFSTAAVFIEAAEYIQTGSLKAVSYILAGVSYLSMLLYIFGRFNFNSELTFLILAASSAAFTLLGYWKSEKNLKLGREKFKKFMALTGILVVTAIVFDVTGAQPETSVELKDSVKVVDGERFSVGTLQVRNDFLLPRLIDVENIDGCLVSPEGMREGIYLDADFEDTIPGKTTVERNLTDTLYPSPEENATITGNYSIKSGDCRRNSENSTIYITDGVDSLEVRRFED